MLNQNEEKTINEMLDKIEKAAIAGKSTELIKDEIIKVIRHYTQLQYKVVYNKGYNAGKRRFSDWEYDPGDSRG